MSEGNASRGNAAVEVGRPELVNLRVSNNVCLLEWPLLRDQYIGAYILTQLDSERPPLFVRRLLIGYAPLGEREREALPLRRTSLYMRFLTSLFTMV